MNKYDVSIIGGGFAGLLCAAILSKNGYKTILFEKNSRPGGCLQSFSYKGAVFDVGLHYFGSAGKGDDLYKLFKYLEIYDKLKINKIDEDLTDLVQIGDIKYKYPSDYDKFIAQMTEYFPSEEKGIKAYVEKIKYCADLFNIEKFSSSQVGYFSVIELVQKNAWEFICEYVEHPELRMLLASPNFLYSGTREDASLYTHALITDHFLRGAYRFRNGSEQLAKRLVEIIEKNGGLVLSNAKVDKIITENKDFKGIELNNKSKYYTKLCISTMHPSVLPDMLSVNKKSPYFNRLKNLDNTISYFAVYFFNFS